MWNIDFHKLQTVKQTVEKQTVKFEYFWLIVTGVRKSDIVAVLSLAWWRSPLIYCRWFTDMQMDIFPVAQGFLRILNSIKQHFCGLFLSSPYNRARFSPCIWWFIESIRRYWSIISHLFDVILSGFLIPTMPAGTINLEWIVSNS